MTSPLIVDNHMLKESRTCLRKYEYAHVLGLKRPFIEPALDQGIEVHAGMAAILEGKSLDEAATIALGEAQQRPPETADDWRTPDVLVAMLAATEAHWRANPLEVVKGLDGKAVVEMEGAFPLPLGDDEDLHLLLAAGGYDSVLYSGRIDAIVRFQGRNYILDHKTNSSGYRSPRQEKGAAKTEPFIDPKVWNSYKPNAQMAGYVWLAQNLIGSKVDISGAIVNIICIGRPTKAEPQARFIIGRHAFEWSPAELAEWLCNRQEDVRRILEAKLRGFWPMNEDSCMDYNRPCPFWDMCKHQPTLRAQLAQGAYVVEKWNPLRKAKP